METYQGRQIPSEDILEVDFMHGNLNDIALRVWKAGWDYFKRNGELYCASEILVQS